MSEKHICITCARTIWGGFCGYPTEPDEDYVCGINLFSPNLSKNKCKRYIKLDKEVD